MIVAAASPWSYVGAAYAITFVSLIVYAAFVIVRGRRVGKHLPPQERRWSQ